MEQDQASETAGTEEICVLCKHSLIDFETSRIGPKGMRTLVELSHLRNDGLSQYFNGQNLTLHIKCRNKYTKTRNNKPIDFEEQDKEWIVTGKNPKLKVKKKKKKDSTTMFQRWSKRVFDKALDNNEPFDYKQNCFLCGYQLDRHQSKNAIVRATRYCTQQYIMKAATTGTETPLQQLILHRIENVDLVAVEAGYHKLCYSIFTRGCLYTKGNGSSDRSSSRTDSIMKIVYDYIEKTEDIQFSTKELRDLVTDANYDLRESTILAHLHKKYEEKLLVVNIPGTGKVITLLDDDLLNH